VSESRKERKARQARETVRYGRPLPKGAYNVEPHEPAPITLEKIREKQANLALFRATDPEAFAAMERRVLPPGFHFDIPDADADTPDE
jgi:hypothetical protein